MANWIVDAGPWIHLDRIGRVGLLKRLPRLLVPASVVKEITTPPASRALSAVPRWSNVVILADSPSPSPAVEAAVAQARLHRGETDCLYAAIRNRPCIILTDDLAARTVAEKLGLEVHGTVGLIVYAVKRQWLSRHQAEDALDALHHRSRLFITYAIIERAIHRLRQSA